MSSPREISSVSIHYNRGFLLWHLISTKKQGFSQVPAGSFVMSLWCVTRHFDIASGFEMFCLIFGKSPQAQES